MIREIHVGDIGTVFSITVKDGVKVVDVSSASSKNVIFAKPDGTVLNFSGTYETDGTDGIVNYTTVLGDLDLIGMWSIQVHIVMPNGEWKSDIGSFDVFSNL